MPKQPTLEAKVKESYRLGPVTAFSGYEFVQNEWRPVPVGFEPAALTHPLLDVRDVESQEEIHVTSKDQLAAWQEEMKPGASTTDEAVTTETEATEEDPGESKSTKKRGRKSKASDGEE